MTFRETYIADYDTRWLVGADDQLRQELVGQAVKVVAVKGGLGASAQVRLCGGVSIVAFGCLV